MNVDVCYRPSPENRERIARALAPVSPYPRGVEPGLPVAWDARALATPPLLTLATSAGPLDLLPDLPGVGGFDAVLAASRPTPLLGVTVPVLGLDALIAAKRAAGRPKDRLLLPELEALRALGA